MSPVSSELAMIWAAAGVGGHDRDDPAGQAAAGQDLIERAVGLPAPGDRDVVDGRETAQRDPPTTELVTGGGQAN